MDNAHLIFKPTIHIRAERVAEVLSIPLEKANQLLSHPETKQFLQVGLERAFQETVDRMLQEMSRVPLAAIAPISTRVDCIVELPPLPAAKAGFGL
jgi:hypothetical protein